MGYPHCKCVKESVVWLNYHEKDKTFRSSLLNIYQSVVEPYFDYCSIVRNGIGDNLADKLQKLQNRAARVIAGADYLTPTKEI